MPKGYKDTDKGMEKILEEMKKLSEMQVKVGFPMGSGEVARDGGENIDIAQIAAWNHYGTTNKDGSVRIPARPFMTDAFDNNRERIGELAEKLISEIKQGKADAEIAARKCAVANIDFVKREIRDGNFVPNSEVTRQGSRPDKNGNRNDKSGKGLNQ